MGFGTLGAFSGSGSRLRKCRVKEFRDSLGFNLDKRQAPDPSPIRRQGLGCSTPSPPGKPNVPLKSSRLREKGSGRVAGLIAVLVLGEFHALPMGPIVVPFLGSYVESYKVIPKRNYYGAFG